MRTVRIHVEGLAAISWSWLMCSARGAVLDLQCFNSLQEWYSVRRMNSGLGRPNVLITGYRIPDSQATVQFTDPQLHEVNLCRLTMGMKRRRSHVS